MAHFLKKTIESQAHHLGSLFRFIVKYYTIFVFALSKEAWFGLYLANQVLRLESSMSNKVLRLESSMPNKVLRLESSMVWVFRAWE